MSRILIDWLSFTTKDYGVDGVKDLLGLSHVSWSPRKCGYYGYRQAIEFLNMTILFDGSPEMGVCCEMSGQGCRAWEEHTTLSGWDDLIRRILVPGFSVTRVDFAYDDFEYVLDLDVLANDTRAGKFSTIFGTYEITDSWNEKDQTQALNIQWGKRGSHMMIRIYDKATEQTRKGKTLEDGTRHPKGSWNRVELQIRDKNCAAFLSNYLKEKNIGDTFRGVLHYYLRYVDPETDSNITRCELLPYWAELLDRAGKLRILETEERAYGIESLVNHTCNNNGAAISTAVQILGADEFIRLCNLRPKKQKYKDLLNEHYGFTEQDLEEIRKEGFI